MTAALRAIASRSTVGVLTARTIQLFRNRKRAVCRCKVDLTGGVACGKQLDTHRRADRKPLAGVATNHRHVLLVVLVEVAGHQLCTNQTLTAVFQRNEHAERLHAGNLRVKFLTDKLLHVGRDIQLVDVAFAVVGSLFAVCGLVCGFLAHRFVCRGKFFAEKRLLQHAVRHQIGITADWRGKVQVELRLQAVMANTLIRVAGTRQRAQQKRRQHALLRVVLCAAQHGLELRRILRLGRVDAVAERTRKRRKHAQLVRIGILVHTVDSRQLALAHILGNRFVGLQHEFLDQLFTLAALTEPDFNRLAVLVHADFRLRNVQLECAALNAALVQRVRQIVHRLGSLDQKSVFLAQPLVAREDFVNLVVGHAGLGADDRLGKFRTIPAAVLIDFHQRGERQTVHLRVERADAVGQRERQHRHNVSREINRCTAAERLGVKRRIRRNVMAHVRDVYAEQIMSVFQLFERYRVVKVLRVIAVDGKDQLVAQIEPLAGGAHIDLLRNGERLLEHLVRKYVIHAVFVQNSRDSGLHRTAFAQIRADNALRHKLLIAVMRDRNSHAVTNGGFAEVMLVHRNLRILFRDRLHEKCLAALHEFAGQLLAGASQHADNGCFLATAVVLALTHLDEHAVAVPRTAGRIRRDEQIIRLGFALRIIRRDKRECPLGSQIGSGRTAVVRGDRKAVFLVFHHPAVRNERIQRVFEIVFACIRQLAPDVLNTARVHQNFQQSGFQFGVCFFIFHIRPSYLRLLAKNYPL